MKPRRHADLADLVRSACTHASHLDRLPQRGEVLQIGGLRIQVLRADSRRVHTLLVDRTAAAS